MDINLCELWHLAAEDGRVEAMEVSCVVTSAANRLIGEVVQSRRRPLLGPSPG